MELLAPLVQVFTGTEQQLCPAGVGKPEGALLGGGDIDGSLDDTFQDLIDVEQGVSTDLGVAQRYRLVALGPEYPYRLVLLAGTEEFVSREGARLVELPPALVLDRNAPDAQ